MATPATVKNIGLVPDTIDGTSVDPGDTLVVDLDDAAVQKELRSDPDRSWLVLPDSAAGTLPPAGGRSINPDFFDFVAGPQVGDVRQVTLTVGYDDASTPEFDLQAAGPGTRVDLYLTDDQDTLRLNGNSAATFEVNGTGDGANGNHESGAPGPYTGGRFVTNELGVIVLDVDMNGVPDTYVLVAKGADGIALGASFLTFT